MIEEIDVVETLSPAEDATVAIGSVGTVVHVYKDGEAYLVEFPIPGEEYETVLATFYPNQLRLVEPRPGKNVRKSA